MAFEVYSSLTDQHGRFPTAEALDIQLSDERNVSHPRSRELLVRLMPDFKQAYVPAQSTADQSV